MATELRGRAPVSHRVAVLGSVAVGNDADLQLRDRTVLGVLVVRLGAAVSTDEIADAIWGEAIPPSSRKVIQGCIGRLRRVLGTAAIATVGSGYRLDVDASDIDAHAFAARIEVAREELALGHAERAVTETRRALAMWRGRPFGEIDGWAPAEAEARRIESVRDSAHDVLIESLLSAGRFDAAATEAEVLIEESPYREQRWALWARGLYAAGRQAEALAALSRLRCLLRDELGIDPGPDIAALELAILQQDPALEIAPAVVTGTRCPWPGLLCYEPGDATDFFGREAEIEACLTRLRASGRLLVVGRSGCGKSSFVRAGLIPRLGVEGESAWLITPGAHPLTGLTGVGHDSLIVVDQAEEALTQCPDVGEREKFFERLSLHRGRVIVVVRADLLDELTAYAGFAELLEGALVVLRPLDEAGLRAVVEGPAAKAGLRLEPGLVELLLGECRDEPGALPLLSHALAETWHRVEGNTLTVDGYRESGGIRAAIATTAEEVYESLDDDRRESMRRLFRRLVSIDGGEPVRSRVRREATDAALSERLLAARLLTVADDGELQLAHEQLARHWPRLTEWISDDLQGQRVLRHLAGEARDWEESGRPVGSLYRGVRLDAALSWAAEHSDELTEVEKDFLDASRLVGESELRRVRRSNARLRVALVSSVVLTVAAIGGGATALHQRRTADQARDTARQARDYSEALRVGALAESAHDPSVALALAAEALTIDSSRASRVQVLEVFGRFSALLSTGEAPADSDWPATVLAEAGGDSAMSPDGKVLAESASSQILLLEPSTREVLGVISDVPTTPNALAFDTSGRLLAGGLSEVGFGDTGTTIVWNVPERREIARFDSGDGEVWGHRFDPYGETVYSYGADGLHQWDLTGAHSIVRTQTGDPTSFRAGDDLLSLWDDSTTVWVTEACRLAGRPLTEDEWHTHVGDRPYDPACQDAGG